MLNTDIELAYDIDVDNTGSGTQCVIGKGLSVRKRSAPCEKADTKNLVATYAGVGKTFVIYYVVICVSI